MLIHPVALGGLALGLLAPPPPRPPVSSLGALITTRYRVETRNETTIDLSGFGQPSQQQDFGLVSWIAVTLSDTAGGRIVTVLVDSMKYTGSLPMLSQATADSARGGVLHGFVDPLGRVKELSSKPATNVFMADVQGVVNSLFPKVKAGAKAGEVWSDTVEVTNTTGGSNLKSRFFIDYTAAGQEQISGIAALKLTSTSTATLTGTMENPAAGTLEVEGTVKGTSTSLVGPDGRFLGGTANSTSDQLVKTPMAPAPIPLKVVRTVTLTLMP